MEINAGVPAGDSYGVSVAFSVGSLGERRAAQPVITATSAATRARHVPRYFMATAGSRYRPTDVDPHVACECRGGSSTRN